MDDALYREQEGQMRLEDGSRMPWGKHAGTRMVDVPAYYLLNMYDMGTLFGPVRVYVEENLDALRKEAEKGRGK